ncbi:MAG: MOSC domain-containing protein [Proteobacteria bacterium]|nr:MOSC domain-containing protein [Pseudomonadota bacterium]
MSEDIITVSDLIEYPVKSCRGIHVKESPVIKTGLSNDRQYMLIDDEDRMISQKTIPAMAALVVDFKYALMGGGDEYSWSNERETQPTPWATLMIGGRRPMFDWSQKPLVVTLHKNTDMAEAVVADDATNKKLSDILGMEVRLVEMLSHTPGFLPQGIFRCGDIVRLADEFPILIASESSLAALAQHFNGAVEMDRFRPNIVLSGARPFAEDTWTRIKVGSHVEFAIVSHCARCVITTIDQEQGKKTGAEPLATLNRLRKGTDGVYFGAYATVIKRGIVHAGDEVEVLETCKLPLKLAGTKANGFNPL